MSYQRDVHVEAPEQTKGRNRFTDHPLPLQTSQVLSAQADPLPSQPTTRCRGTLLVVDDTEQSVFALRELLTTHQFNVETALDGQTAIALAQSSVPDLILLDIKMPNTDGFQICQLLKKDRLTQEIPVIFISALDEVFDKVRAFQSGAVDYITKPFQIEEVLIRVETQLNVRRLHERLVSKNRVLSEALMQLKETQRQLIESEKMATLGNLVAGIAHEINTPIGIGVTAASTLQDETDALEQLYSDGHFTRNAFEMYLQTAQQSSQLILNNLQRASDLVQSFKHISADQIHLERRKFVLHEYLQEIVRSLEPTLKHSRHRIRIDSKQVITMESYPGAISQVVTNLVMNSLNHAYPMNGNGTLQFSWCQQKDRVILLYSDDGSGIAKTDLHYIFDPFFTTARGRGGTGLGLHIVYNLVTQKLGGTIRCESEPNLGTKFILDIPCHAPDVSI